MPFNRGQRSRRPSDRERINTINRELQSLHAKRRQALARDPSLTHLATVGLPYAERIKTLNIDLRRIRKRAKA